MAAIADIGIRIMGAATAMANLDRNWHNTAIRFTTKYILYSPP